MQTLRQQILDRIRHHHGGDGAVVTPKDFLDVGRRDAVDQALNRLARSGELVRVGRGLYHLPRTNVMLGITIPPDPDKVADALGRQTRDEVASSPAVAANRLGLSTQIPAKSVYLTTGRSRTVKVAGRAYRLKHTSAGRMPESDSVVDQLLQAIETLGSNPDPANFAAIRRTLSEQEQRLLLQKARYRSEKVADIAWRIVYSSEPSHRVARHG